MKQNTYQRPRSLAEAEAMEATKRPAAPAVRIQAPKVEPRVEAKPVAPARAPKREAKPRSEYGHHAQDPKFQLHRRVRLQELAHRKAFTQQIVAALPEEDLVRCAEGSGWLLSNLRIFARTGQTKLRYLVPLEEWLETNGLLRVVEKVEDPQPVARRRRLSNYESVAMAVLLCGGHAA